MVIKNDERNGCGVLTPTRLLGASSKVGLNHFGFNNRSLEKNPDHVERFL